MTRPQKILTAVAFGIPFLCCLGGFGWIQWRLNSAGANLEDELAKLRSKGIPTVAAELERSLPNSQNGAAEYRKAFAMVTEGSDQDRALRALNGFNPKKATAEQRAEAEQHFAALAGLVKTIEAGADYPGLHFGHDWSRGMMLEFPEFAHLKSFQKLLAHKAMRQSRAGDWRGSLATVDRMFNLSQQAGSDPVMIGMLVQISTEAIAHTRLRETMRDHAHNPAALAEARRVLDRQGPVPSMRKALGGEVVFGRAAIAELGNYSLSFNANEPPNAVERTLLNNPSLKRAFDVKLVEHYNWLYDRMPDDPENWEDAAAVMRELDARLEKDESLLDTMNDIIMPVFGQAAEAIGRTVAQRRLSKVTLELYRIRNQTGAFPATLPNLGTTSTDPYGRKQLVYKREGEGFLLYSVDRDLKDDGGKTTGPGPGRDIVVDTRN